MLGEAALCIAIFCEWRHHYRMAAVQAHLNLIAIAQQLRPRGMSCQAIYQLRLSISKIKNSTYCSRLLSQTVAARHESPVPDKSRTSDPLKQQLYR